MRCRLILSVLGPVVLALAAIGPLPAVACAFHFYAPERTAIEWLLESDHIVTARPDPDAPFQYLVVETLWGDERSVAMSRLVDRPTRRRFARDPGSTVVFAYDRTEDSWRSLGFADDEYRPIVDQVLARRADWAEGYHKDRFAIAQALHDHSDPWLRRLGLAELDRAPYALLRTLDLRLDADFLLTNLWSLTTSDEVPIRVLLLGLSHEEAARHAIVAQIHNWQTLADTQHLGLFATALIEINGAHGLDLLATLFLSDLEQPLAKLEAVIEAMAIHSTSGAEAIRHQIQTILTLATEKRPDLAEVVAKHFANRSDWTMARTLEQLLAQNRLASVGAMLQVSRYVALARQGDRLNAIGLVPLGRGG